MGSLYVIHPHGIEFIVCLQTTPPDGNKYYSEDSRWVKFSDAADHASALNKHVLGHTIEFFEDCSYVVVE